MIERFGRTNAPAPPVWFRLRAGFEREAVASLPESAVVDVSSMPPYFGEILRPRPDLRLMIGTGFEIERSTSEAHAHDLTSALVIQFLSSLGRSTIEIIALQVRRSMEDFQISGALGALEEAREAEILKFLALSLEGPAFAVMPTWRFNDAFEIVIVDGEGSRAPDYPVVQAHANERRVGVVVRGASCSVNADEARLVDLSTLNDLNRWNNGLAAC